VGQVIFPTPEHLGHSLPLTFLLPLQMGQRMVLCELQDLQAILIRPISRVDDDVHV